MRATGKKKLGCRLIRWIGLPNLATGAIHGNFPKNGTQIQQMLAMWTPQKLSPNLGNPKPYKTHIETPYNSHLSGDLKGSKSSAPMVV